METLKDFYTAYEVDQTDSLDVAQGGSVYRAVDQTDQQAVGVKLVEIPARFDKGFLFQRYTKAKTLNHPNLLPYNAVYRFEEGLVNNIAVMPIVQGGNLRNHFDLDDANKKLIADQVLDGLFYLHGQGIVWQNLSAKHILIDQEFGNYIPKFINYGNTDRIPLAFFSDYEYLAPEQFDEQAKVDERSDIWAYGVLLYGLWTGRLPFGEKTATLPNLKIQERILGDWEPGLINKIPEPYQTIVEKCLKPKKEDRWANCGEIIVVIKEWLAPVETPSVNQTPSADERRFWRKPSQPIVWWQVVLLLVLAALLGSLLG